MTDDRRKAVDAIELAKAGGLLTAGCADLILRCLRQPVLTDEQWREVEASVAYNLNHGFPSKEAVVLEQSILDEIVLATIRRARGEAGET